MCRRVASLRSGGDSGSAAEGDGGALRAQIIKKPARALRHFDRSGAEWRNLTPPWYRRHYGGRSLDSEYHQSVFHLSPIAACGSARDDDVGEQHWTHLRCEGSKGSKGWWYRPQGDEFYNAACGGHVSIEYHNQDYHRPHRLRWMASHWIRGSRGSPMNPVRLHTLRHFVALFP